MLIGGYIAPADSQGLFCTKEGRLLVCYSITVRRIVGLRNPAHCCFTAYIIHINRAVFEDATIADAVLDRVVNNTYRIGLRGPTLRASIPQDDGGDSTGKILYVKRYA